MVGHKDPEGTIMKDKDGKLYIAILDNKKVEEPKEEIKEEVVPEEPKKSKKLFKPKK